jgi:DNA invertase Pin-like site-specific DNA recombinase
VRENAPRQAIIYTRISDARNGDTAGVTDQAARCRELAARHGWQIARVITENDVSAFKRRKITLPDGRRVMRVVRPGWRDMLDDLATGRATALVCLDLDRAARDPRDLEDLIDVIESSTPRIPVESVTGSLRLATDADITMARVMVAVGNKSSRDTARRVAAARDRKAAVGGYGGGRRPFGYEKDGITVRAAEAAEVIRAADAILTGVSLRAVTASLRNRGVPTVTGAAWTTRTIRDILLRPRNAGIVTHRGEEAGPAAWPAILPEATWRAVAAQLTSPKRRTSPGNAPRWLLSLIARCGVCGATVSAGAGRAQQPRYVCREHNHLSRVARPCDQLVANLVIARLSQPDAAGLLTRRPGVDTPALAREVNVLRRLIDEAGDMWEAGEITRAERRARVTRLRTRLDAAEGTLADATSGDPLSGLAGHLDAARWATLDIGRQRAIVDLLLKVTLLPASRLGRQPDGSYFDPASVAITWRMP